MKIQARTIFVLSALNYDSKNVYIEKKTNRPHTKCKNHSCLPRIRENSCAYNTVVDHGKKEELKGKCCWKKLFWGFVWSVMLPERNAVLAKVAFFAQNLIIFLFFLVISSKYGI